MKTINIMMLMIAILGCSFILASGLDDITKRINRIEQKLNKIDSIQNIIRCKDTTTKK